MYLTLTEQEVKEAVAEYINRRPEFQADVLPEDITIGYRSYGEYRRSRDCLRSHQGRFQPYKTACTE